MKNTAKALQSYLQTHPLDTGDDDCSTVLDQLYLAYANSHESDPPEIQTGFAELETFLGTLPLSDNNAPCSIFAAASASITSAKPSLTACSTVRS